MTQWGMSFKRLQLRIIEDLMENKCSDYYRASPLNCSATLYLIVAAPCLTTFVSDPPTTADKISADPCVHIRRSYSDGGWYLIRHTCIVLIWYNTISIHLLFFTSCYQLGIDLFVLLSIQYSLKPEENLHSWVAPGKGFFYQYLMKSVGPEKFDLSQFELVRIEQLHQIWTLSDPGIRKKMTGL